MSKTLQSYKTYSISLHHLFKPVLNKSLCAKTLKSGFLQPATLSQKNECCEKILLGVPNEAVLFRITKVHLDIKRSLH